MERGTQGSFAVIRQPGAAVGTLGSVPWTKLHRSGVVVPVLKILGPVRSVAALAIPVRSVAAILPVRSFSATKILPVLSDAG